MANWMIPALVRWLSRRALRWFYRERRYRGLENVPTEGAVLLYGNHPNDLPDVLSGLFATRRPLRYLATISATTLPLAKATYRGLGVIPVTRVRDVRKMRALGVDVKEVNRVAFSEFRRAVEAEEVIGVFPEGGVHDTSQLGRFKTGVAGMILSSIDAGANIDLTLVPFGVQYEAPRTPRSDLIVEIGSPKSIKLWLANTEHPTAAGLADWMHQMLVSATRNSRSWELAEARDRLVAAVAAVTAAGAAPSERLAERNSAPAPRRLNARRTPLLEIAADVQRRCAQLVEDESGDIDWGDADLGDADLGVTVENGRVNWRTIADDLTNAVGRVGGIPTSARDVARVIDAAGAPHPQAAWPSVIFVVVAAVPALLGLGMVGPMMRAVWWFARETAQVRTDHVAKAIVPGLHLILFGHLVLGGVFALALRATSLSGWWAIPAVMVLPRLGDVGLLWLDAVRALTLRARVRRLSPVDQQVIRESAARVRAAWMAVTSSL